MLFFRIRAFGRVKITYAFLNIYSGLSKHFFLLLKWAEVGYSRGENWRIMGRVPAKKSLSVGGRVEMPNGPRFGK